MVSFSLMDMLEVIGPFKQFSKLRTFMESKLPPGFPVKIGKSIYLANNYLQLSVSHLCKWLYSLWNCSK